VILYATYRDRTNPDAPSTTVPFDGDYDTAYAAAKARENDDLVLLYVRVDRD